jgi:chromosome transmission fidelity protein 1
VAAAKSGSVRPDPGPGSASSDGGGTGGGSGLAAMHALAAFMGSLTNTDAEGRIIIEPACGSGAGPGVAGGGGGGDASAQTTRGSGASDAGARSGRLRFVLLNAARHFGRLLSGARAVVLASGTLSPVSSLRAQLFPHELPSRIRHFDCGHVVPADQLLAVSVGRGPGCRPLDFRHAARGRGETLDEAGALLLNLAAVVPAGMVAFAPSFAYLDQLAARWKDTGLMARLEARKAVFVEPRGAAEVEAMLARYAAAALGASSGNGKAGGSAGDAMAGGGGGDSGGGRDQEAGSSGGAAPPPGALLLCVMGGKLSEGINFGDGLGR